jgi:hypothetical protein
VDAAITPELFYRLSERRLRISLDFDKPVNRFASYRAFFMLKTFFPRSEIKVERTGHGGLHVKAVGKEIAKIPMLKRVEIREKLGDDPARIEWDKAKLKDGQDILCETLFVMKRGFDRKLRKVEDMNIFALPFASRFPAKKPTVSRRTAYRPSNA